MIRKSIGALLATLSGVSIFTLATVISGGDSREDVFIQRVRQLTYLGKRSGEGYFSADGRHLIFQAERQTGNPFYEIYVLSFGTGEVHRVSPGTGKTTCAFFRPNSNRVLFASTHLDPQARKKQEDEIAFRASGKKRRYSWDYDEQFDMFSANRDGSEIKRLTNAPGYDAEGAYSPDGTKIVFCSLRNAYPTSKLSKENQQRMKTNPAYFGEIYITDADGTNPTQLTDWPGYDGGPFFSADGERIVWRHFSEDGMTADIYTMHIDGSDRIRLTDFKSMSWAPYFHPTGEYVIFTTNKHGFGNFELFIVDASGKKKPVRVTYTKGFDGLPVFSPDGKHLSWTSKRSFDGKAQIFIADWDHNAALAALRDAPPRGTTIEDKGEAQRDAVKPILTPKSKVRPSEKFTGAVTAGDLRAMVDYLASDELEGRMTGKPGARKAGDYIAARFKEIGLKPLGDDGTYFQTFPFTSGARAIKAENHLTVTDAKGETHTLACDEDFRPLSFAADGTVEGEVVFAGYGLTVPGDEKTGYNSYAGLDVKGKIVLVLRYAPEDVGTDRRGELNHYAGLRYKAMLARENGAKALLIAIGPRSPNAGKLVPMRFDQSLASSGIPVASVSGRVAELLFSGCEKTLEKVQSGLDIENPHVPGHFKLPGVKAKLTTTVHRDKSSCRNVIGYLPPGNGSQDSSVVVLGAHYDHIGHGEIGSLARKGEEGKIHNGADDNASGTATVIELAAALAQERRKAPEEFCQGVIFAAWSGEELGVIGSNYFVKHPTLAWDRVAAYVNFDMVGRMRDNRLVLQGIGSSDVWLGLIERHNVPAAFRLTLQIDPYLPTDATAFYPKGVPILNFFTGSHGDYNRPTDDADTLNYEDMQRIGELAGNMALDLIGRRDRPKYVKVDRSKERTGFRASLRAYLGTIPDYAAGDIEGVKLSGVRNDGPADKAGMRGGDVIVKFGGRDIENIYDYTYAIDAVKIGKPAEIVVLRDGKRVTLTIVPEARK